MKLRKSEWAAVILTVLLLCGFFGFRLGRDSTPAVFSVSAAKEAVPRSDAAEASDSLRVDINHADQEALCTLPGIGEVLAERIIAFREENGAFERIEDITKVSGIGIGTFEKLRDSITVGETKGEAGK